MAQSGYTPILIYASGTASAVPSGSNMTSSASGAELALNYADGKLYYKNSGGTVTLLASAAGASGDVVGPSSATDNAVARFDGTTGKLIQNGVVLIGDTGAVTGVTDLTTTGNTILGDASTDTVRVNGYMGVGGAASGAYGLYVLGDTTTGISQYGVASLSTLSGTNWSASVLTGPLLKASTAYTDVAGLRAINATTASGASVSRQYGLYIDDQTLGTFNYGIRSIVSSGTNKWNIYASGTAQNYFAGSVGIGVAAPAYPLDVLGNGHFASAAGEIFVSPTGYRVADRASIGIKTLTNNPAEIDLLNTNGGLNYGWQISSRDGTAPTLDFYRNTNNSFSMALQMGLASTIFNPELLDTDFRVASDTNSYAIYMDAGVSRVGINTGSLYQALNVSGAIESGTSSSTNGSVVMYGAYNGASNDYISLWGTQFSSGGPTMAYGLSSSGGTAWNSTYDNFSGTHSVLVLDGSNLRFYSDETSSATTVGSPVTVYERMTISRNEAVFNEDSRDVDFRVESDTNTHMLFVDAGNNQVFIGAGSGNSTGTPLNVVRSGTAGTITKLLSLYDSNFFPSGYPTLELVGWQGGGNTNRAYVSYEPGSRMVFYTSPSAAGDPTPLERAAFGNSETVFNEISADVDFRIESDTNAYAFFLDAGTNRINIGTSTAYQAAFTTFATGSYSSGDVNAIFASSARSTVRLRTTVDDAAELFFDVNGAVRWDISARSSSESYVLRWYPQAASPSLGGVGADVMSLTQAGALTAVSKSFSIDHPLPSMSESHHLVHMSVESPQADLIYRGVATLENGRATVNIDENSNMTEGTFVLLCREVQCFTTNETDWTPVRGSVSGNILTIESQDANAASTISWMVIGERQDKQMFNLEITDDNGKVIVEPLKEQATTS